MSDFEIDVEKINYSGMRIQPGSRSSMSVSIIIMALLGWLALWNMTAEHARMGGGYESLGTGMIIFEKLLGTPDGVELSRETYWTNICWAVVGSDNTFQDRSAITQLGISLIMWITMSVAMMLPTAIPVIRTFEDIQIAAKVKGMRSERGWTFALGYIAIWSIIALFGSALQLAGSHLIGNDGMSLTVAPLLGGLTLIAVGLYQFSKLKYICLSQCRSPMKFFMVHWHDGSLGAWRMGFLHGLYCVGCCWALMSLMFVGGTMNLIWMAILSVIMLLEKTLSDKNQLARIFSTGWGIIFTAWGMVLLCGGFIEMGIF